MLFKKEIFKKTNWILLFIVLLGGFFRFYNLNWDEGHFFHPDERNIAAAVSRINFFSQLDPGFFAYGSFPIYLYRGIGEFLFFLTNNHNWVLGWDKINLIGRIVSAFLSTLSIALVFYLVRKIGSLKLAILSAFFTAFSPSLIQTAHFAVTESMLVFWILLLIYYLLIAAEEPSTKNHFRIGIIFGLAVATKISALSFLSVILSAHFLYHPKINFPIRQHLKKIFKYNLKLLLTLLVAFLIFSSISPSTYLSWSKFIESMAYESGVVSGKLRVVYVLQFEKTMPYLFQIKNLFWQLGPVALWGILGVILVLVSAFRTRNKKLFILLCFPVFYFLYVGSWYTKFIRYMVPIIPFLAIFGAWTLTTISQKRKGLGKILTWSTVLICFGWSAAFSSIYTRESTRISASKWIYENVPPGSKILQEHWDDGLPIDTAEYHPSRYSIEQLTIYEPDNPEKIRYYAEKLSEADYLVINSRRLYGTLIHLPEKYPVTSFYYKMLFSGALGYQRVVQFISYPKLFGIKINDDSSEETFQVYDHPKVIILKNNGRLNQKEIIGVLSNYHD